MSNPQPTRKRNLAYRMRKYLVSVFVVASFAAYALHERRSDPNVGSVVEPDQASNQTSQRAPAATIYPPAATDASTPASAPTDPPQATSLPPSATAVPTEPPATDPPTQPAPTEPPPTDVPPTVAPTA